MKHTLTFVAIMILIALAGCSGTTGQPAAGDKSAQEQPAAQENVIWASGKLLPARWAGLH